MSDWAALEREPLVDFRRGTAVTAIEAGTGRIVVQTATEALDAAYLVAADGANSVIRGSAGISLRGRVMANMAASSFTPPGGTHPARSARCSAGSTSPPFSDCSGQGAPQRNRQGPGAWTSSTSVSTVSAPKTCSTPSSRSPHPPVRCQSCARSPHSFAAMDSNPHAPSRLRLSFTIRKSFL
ncbi:FAD-dependent monooxygenase [Amycolatopsis sp. NPDC004169]|uniref:FAD-dependent oxidoreductase n=1 Tax=Amycolatopsis sp. NPDC004169 TaxID=3154453 RepID=UPI0033AA1D91